MAYKKKRTTWKDYGNSNTVKHNRGVDTNVGWYICSAAIYASIGMVML